MFVHDINPVFLEIGFLQIRYYGIVYAFGFLFTMWYMLRLSRKKILGLNEDETYSIIIYTIFGVLIGARLFEILFYHPSYYFSNPSQILAYWNGGLSFHGGFIGAIIGVALFVRKYKVKVAFYEIADALVVPIIFALALGRIANFINGELYGKVTSLPWAVKFPGADGFRHPTQIYESIDSFIIFFYLNFLTYRKSQKEKNMKGFVFWNFIAFYGLFRFVIEFWKEPETLYFGVPVGQAFSLVMFIAGSYMIYFGYLKNRQDK